MRIAVSKIRRKLVKLVFFGVRGFLNRFGFDLRRTWFRHLWAPEPYLFFAPSESDVSDDDYPLPRATVMIYLNLGSTQEDLLENSILSARSSGYEGEIWVWGNFSSEEARVRLMQAGMTKFKPLRKKLSATESKRFGDDGFIEITHKKWEVIHATLVTTSKTVIFSDNDVVWLRNPDPYFKKASGYFEIGIQSESRDSFPPAFCLGLLYVTPRAIDVLDFLIASSRTNASRGTAQQVFNEVINANPRLLYSILTLPEAVFPVGLSYPLLAGDQHENVVHTPEIIAFHANWLPDSSSKKRALESIGLWKL